eukprot:COSAG01_NODE_14_length_41020_cov_40.702133_47_plen_136_part_00
MGKRQTGRKLAMQLLFQYEFSERKNDSAPENNKLLSEDSVQNESKSFGLELANAAWKFHEESDILIQKYSIDWDIKRISDVDKALLRLSFYELIHTDTEASIVINEILELAKKFSSSESVNFLNGILGTYIKENV